MCVDGVPYPQRQVKQVNFGVTSHCYQHSEKTKGSVLTEVSEIRESRALWQI